MFFSPIMHQCCRELWWASRAGGGGGQNKKLLSVHPRTEWKPLGWLGGAISMRTMLAAVRKMGSAPFVLLAPRFLIWLHVSSSRLNADGKHWRGKYLRSSGLFKEQFSLVHWFLVGSEWNLDPQTTHSCKAVFLPPFFLPGQRPTEISENNLV